MPCRSLLRVYPDFYTLSAALRACSADSLIRPGQQVHALAITSSIAGDPLVSTRLIDMYFSCRLPAVAAWVFDSVLPPALKNHVLWTMFITGLTKNGETCTAMERFRSMRALGIESNQFTLLTMLSACASERVLRFGCQVHGCTMWMGFGSSPFVQSSLVSLYSKCSDFSSAKQVFQTSDLDDPVSWNALIVSCARGTLHEDALSLFPEMHH
ncbi:pentatricopeptide repeat-containing protein [Canna indica]|uniref:Pentatricopeptide repeat-containing protein n=1 Tax=Canna indica TaxID=4628 RepID=A0AAQ3QN01_9LILI|nr:pentatricopeptide repeat-containing protein [Canna indica]